MTFARVCPMCSDAPISSNSLVITLSSSGQGSILSDSAKKHSPIKCHSIIKPCVDHFCQLEKNPHLAAGLLLGIYKLRM